MRQHVLPVPSRSVRWLVLPVSLLILYATWSQVQEHSYWTAGLQFSMLAFLPFVFSQLNDLPATVKFDDNHLYIRRNGHEDAVLLSHIEAIASTFFSFNNQSVFQVRYFDGKQRKRIYVISGLMLSTLDALWAKQSQ